MTFSDLKKVGWRTYPMKMTVEPADAVHATIITYESVELDGDVPDDTFSLRRLQSGRD